MKKNFLLNLFILIVAVAPLIYLAIIWNSLPESIAMHYNGNMQPDRMGNKNGLWLPVAIISFVSILVFFLLHNMRRFDPKQHVMEQSATFNKIAALLVIFMCMLNFIIIISASKGSFVLEKYLFPLMGLLFAFMGNYMNNIKPNYFAGFRLPWTLSDNDNWRKTHHLASKLWFAGGIFIAIISLVIPFKLMLSFFIGIVLIMTIIPTIYSYQLFKAKANGQ